MKNLIKPRNSRYIGLFLSTALCLVSVQVKASERVFQNFSTFNEDSQEIAQSTQQSQTLVLSGNDL